MVFLFQTAHTPSSYRAPICSLAFFFRVLCVIILYVVPIIICIFYYFHMNQYQTDQEFPIVTPGDIEYLSLILRDNTQSPARIYSQSFPSDIGVDSTFTPILEVVQNTNTNGNVESIDLRVKQPNLARTTEIIGISCVFGLQVTLSNWARSSTQAYGFYSQTFPLGLESFSVEGELVLYQNEVVDFRGSLPNDVTPTMNPVNLKNLMNAQSNLSSVYRVKWYDYVPQYNVIDSSTSSYTFEAGMTVMIRDISIIHSLPLISIIESIVILYLSTYILVSIILNSIQHYVFTKGIIRTVRDQHYASTVNSALKKLQK